MLTKIDNVIGQINSNNLFLMLKNVKENAGGWHNNEKVFDHSVKTKNIAEKVLKGNFIANPEAKKLFLQWTENNVYGVKQKDLSLLIALIHDCGKILHYKEADIERTLITDKPNVPGEFMCPGHEYLGAKIVIPKLLKDINLPEKVKEYIQQVVEYHGFFSNPYFPSRENWSLEKLIADVKSHYAGQYIEGLFNMFCDGYTAPAFALGKNKIEELFNTPSFYTNRSYFIPNE